MLSVREFKELLKSNDCGHDFGQEVCGTYGSIPHPKYNSITRELEAQGYKLTREDGHGGEGEGDDYWGVISLEKDGEKAYFQFSGWYRSYYGAEVDIDSVELVKKVPVQRYEWKPL